MEKKSKAKTIVIVILVLAVLGLGGYIVYDKVLSKETEEPVKKEQKKETKQEDLDEISDILMQKLNESKVWDILSVKGLPDSMTFDNNTIDNKVIKIEIDNQNGISSPVKTQSIDEYFKNTYGITNIDYSDIICAVDNTVFYKYDDSNKEYKFVGNHPHGADDVNLVSPIYVKLNNITKENGNYVLTVTEVYANIKDDEFISADPKGTVKIADFDNYLLEDGATINTNKVISDYENTFENKKANYPKYKYIFKKDNDDYYLIGYELVK